MAAHILRRASEADVKSTRFIMRREIVAFAAVATLVIGMGSLAGLGAQGDIATEFKYGSIGTEDTVGIPYWVFKVLPEVFADRLPDRSGQGWERIGFTYETTASDLPMGTTKSTDW